jgi:ribosomal protein S18 acetylase RimI-like enzyme
MRMLGVHPSSRGIGVGRRLADQRIRLAVRDHAEVFALHTSRIMSVAFAMYERMGFIFQRETPVICGVPYGNDVRSLRND